MKQLTITAENFSAIRETLKTNESVNVNNAIVLTSFIANTQYVGQSGKITRTPFLYIDEEGNRYNSTQLKGLLNIIPETKGTRKETTFETLWEQCKLLAKNEEHYLTLKEFAENKLTEIETKKKAEKEKETKRKALLKKLTKEERELLGL